MVIFPYLRCINSIFFFFLISHTIIEVLIKESGYIYYPSDLCSSIFNKPLSILIENFSMTYNIMTIK